MDDPVKIIDPPERQCPIHGDQGFRTLSFFWGGPPSREEHYCFDCYHEFVRDNCRKLVLK